mgnify:CR=1 FL=1
MSTVQDTTSAGSAYGATAGAAKGGAQQTQDRFLSLLVAQMKNQDPLNPLDNAQVTSQMAQLSTVEGIEKMNAGLEALAASMGASQLSQAASLLGHGVLVPGDRISPAEYENLIGFELSRPADKVTATVYDASGKAVRTLDLGARDGGVGMVAWDGLKGDGTPAPDGQYRFEIEAIQGGKPLSVTPLSLGIVNSVSQDGQGVQLNLSGNQSVGYADIRRIF